MVLTHEEVLGSGYFYSSGGLYMTQVHRGNYLLVWPFSIPPSLHMVLTHWKSWSLVVPTLKVAIFGF